MKNEKETFDWKWQDDKKRGIFNIPNVLKRNGYDHKGDTFAIVEIEHELKLCYIGHSVE